MIKSYDVTIKATIIKTIRVAADSIEKATELAHESFSVLNDREDEYYNEETLNVEQVKE